ncbi:MAG: hypothetical protein JJT82_08230 [Legionellaceae bacterium]|nr:hypothetical protein [Legionellaceae bacterium]
MLQQTKIFLRIYGKRLIELSITDEQLEKLLAPLIFQRSPLYIAVKEVSDDNFSESEGMKDFVRHLAPQMTLANLHQLIARMIPLIPQEIEENKFMRNNSLAKTLLAYEFAVNPAAAETHFTLSRMQKELPSDHARSAFKEVILKPIIDYFQENPLDTSTLASGVTTLEMQTIPHPAPKETHTNYQEAKALLQGHHETLDEGTLKKSLASLLAHSEHIRNDNEQDDQELIDVLRNTYRFLNQEITTEDYRNSAQQLTTHASISMRLLASAMLVLGALIVAAGTILFSDYITSSGQQLMRQGCATWNAGSYGRLFQTIDTVRRARIDPAQQQEASITQPT